VERPGQGIGGADGRRGRVARLRKRERRGGVAVISLEQRELDIDDDPAGLEQLDLGAGELDVAGASSVGRRCLGIGEGDHVFGQRQDVGRALEQAIAASRSPAPTANRPSPRARGVAGHEREGSRRRRPRRPPVAV
jgi:hypothetical protein